MNTHDSSPRSSRLPEGFVFTGTLFAVGQLAAQTPAAPAEKKKEEQKTENMGEMVVQADLEKSLYKPERLQSPKMTQPLRDIAQTVTVVPQEVIQEQNATTLRDVLRNVPGISLQAGEGGVPAGDNLSIRGFSARTDLFVDGVRDFGGYTRDPFNLEQIEVAKGPASTNAGRGSTGGSVNLVSKAPRAGGFYDIMLGGGTDDYARTTIDVNQEIPWCEGAAFRLNAMYHHADTPGRDIVTNERWGVAPSITFGLGTDTRFTASYFYMGSDDIPDYGLPWVAASNSALPGFVDQIAPVDDENFYGLVSRDYLKNETHLVTAELEHDFNSDLRLRNLTRYGHTTTDSIVTAPRFEDLDPAPGNQNQFGTVIRRTDWKSRDQIDTILANQTDLNFDFETGSLKHEAVAGVEFSLETSKNYGRSDLNPAGPPTTDLFLPNPYDPYVALIARNGSGTDTEAFSTSAYLFDTVEVAERWMLSGGLRWDCFDVDYLSKATDGTVTALSRDDSMLSYRGAVTYKPCEEGSIYFGYGTSFNPSAEGLSLSNSATSTANVNTDPEESETFELGTKWELLDQRVLVTAAVFRTDKTNARTQDPADPNDTIVLQGEQRVDGLELGVAGSVTDFWRVTGGYTFMDSEVLDSKNPAEVGKEVSNTPEHTFSLWNVFTFPGEVEAGFGTYFVDSRFSNNTNAREAPSYWLVDAMVGWQVNETVSLQLNLNNIFDQDYIGQVGGGHAIPGAGRSAVLSTRFTF